MNRYTDAQKMEYARQAMAMIDKPGGSQRKAADKLGVPQSALNGWLAKYNAGQTESEDLGEGKEYSSDRTSAVLFGRAVTADELLEKHGEKPEDWVVTSIRVSEWGKEDNPMFQLRINARRKDSLLVIPDLRTEDTFEFGQIEECADHSVAFIPDLHAPFVNWRAFGAVLDLLAAEQPGEIVLLGDAGDHTALSSHRTHPRFAAKLNATLDSVVLCLKLIRRACPDARIVFLPGNHDERISYYAREVATEFDGVRPGLLDPDEEEVPSLGFRRLYQLDALGIELVDEDWKLAKHNVAPELSARHGYLTGPSAERKMLTDHRKSQVHGHTHHAGITYKTSHDPLDIRVALDAGTLSEVKEDGLGYATAPDWTPGIGWGYVWESGLFQLSFIPFVQDKLLTPWGMAFDGKEVA